MPVTDPSRAAITNRCLDISATAEDADDTEPMERVLPAIYLLLDPKGRFYWDMSGCPADRMTQHAAPVNTCKPNLSKLERAKSRARLPTGGSLQSCRFPRTSSAA